jgi:hypothetical protein
VNPLNRFVYSAILILLLVAIGCKKDPVEFPVNQFVHFPIGQKSINDSSLKVEADSLIREYTIFHDEYGGRWVRIPFSKLNANSIVRISFVLKTKPLVYFQQVDPVPGFFINPSAFIDADHASIVQKSDHLTNGIDGRLNKAKSIQLFVHDYLELKIYKDCGLTNASKTLEMKYGVCINYARLFVALCRATGIPARTVWGAVNTGGGSYRSHHAWAEFLDEEGNWHTVGLSFTKLFDLNDIRYLDLMYASEENYHYQEYELFTISPEGDYFYYDGSGSAVDGKLNAETLVDNFPDEMAISMSYAISGLFEN